MTIGIHHKFILLSTILLLTLFNYDSVLHWLAVLLHCLFESVEYVLDGCVEHVFDTGTHDTQIIVFYLLMSLIGYGIYRFYCVLPGYYQRAKIHLAHDKAEMLNYWQFLPLFKKLQYSSTLAVLVSGWLYFGF